MIENITDPHEQTYPKFIYLLIACFLIFVNFLDAGTRSMEKKLFQFPLWIRCISDAGTPLVRRNTLFEYHLSCRACRPGVQAVHRYPLQVPAATVKCKCVLWLRFTVNLF